MNWHIHMTCILTRVVFYTWECNNGGCVDLRGWEWLLRTCRFCGRLWSRCDKRPSAGFHGGPIVLLWERGAGPVPREMAARVLSNAHGIWSRWNSYFFVFEATWIAVVVQNRNWFRKCDNMPFNSEDNYGSTTESSGTLPNGLFFPPYLSPKLAPNQSLSKK